MFEDGDDDFIDPRTLPIYQKEKEIFDVVRQICDLIPEANKELEFTNSIMMEDAMMLRVKVAGATGAGLYDLKMENAAIIRKAARDLIVRNHTLQMLDFK